MCNENCDVWLKNLMRNYPGVDIEKVVMSKRKKGFIVYANGERMPLSKFLKNFSKFRISRINY